jgi:hypothetical protein
VLIRQRHIRWVAAGPVNLYFPTCAVGFVS